MLTLLCGCLFCVPVVDAARPGALRSRLLEENLLIVEQPVIWTFIDRKDWNAVYDDKSVQVVKGYLRGAESGRVVILEGMLPGPISLPLRGSRVSQQVEIFARYDPRRWVFEPIESDWVVSKRIYAAEDRGNQKTVADPDEILVIISSLYGLSDVTGHQITPVQYSSIGDFEEDRARVRDEKGLYGYIDRSGVEIIPTEYAYIAPFRGPWAQIRDDRGRYGYMDRQGREVIPPKYSMIEKFDGPWAKVRDMSGRYGFIDEQGREVVPPKYSSIGAFEGEWAKVRDVSGRYGYIDRQGREVVVPKYSSIASFNEHWDKVRDVSGRYGLADKEGREIVAPKYSSISSFEGDWARVRDVSGRYGYIDRQGREVVPPKYSSIGAFEGEWAKVRDVSGRYGYIDRQGREVVPAEYAYVSAPVQDRILVCQSDLMTWVVLDEDAWKRTLKVQQLVLFGRVHGYRNKRGRKLEAPTKEALLAVIRDSASDLYGSVEAYMDDNGELRPVPESLRNTLIQEDGMISFGMHSNYQDTPFLSARQALMSSGSGARVVIQGKYGYYEKNGEARLREW